MFTQLRTRIHNYLLSRQLKKLNRNSKIINYYEANSIGILADASDLENFRAAADFADQLHKDSKKVNILFYLKDPKQAETFSEQHFTTKNVNLWFVPKGEAVKTFINTSFDILINLSVSNNLPLEYISSVSKATYKTGRYIKQKTHCHDLMVYLNEGKQIKNLIVETKHLLKEINKPQNAAI